MSFPKFLSKEETLDGIKKEFESNSNFEVIKQFSYTKIPKALLSFKVHSFIVYKDKTDDKYKVATTTNKNIELLSDEAFKNFNTSELSNESQSDYKVIAYLCYSFK